MTHGSGARVIVTAQVEKDLQRLGHQATNQVNDFVRRLREDRTNRSLRLTPLRAAGRNGDLLLAAVPPRHAVLLLRTEEARFTVLAARQGEQAHDELSRLTVSINPISGLVEVIDQARASDTVLTFLTRSAPDDHSEPAPQEQPAAPVHPLPTALFGGYSDVTLTGLGVSRSLLPSIRRITSREQLDAILTNNVPELTRDVLLALADNTPVDEIRRRITDAWHTPGTDPEDWAGAARHPALVSTEDDAVLDALGNTFEAWRLFLHPEQRRLATTRFKGSAKVTGGPGTGKTVVALHRVRHLVAQLPPGYDRPVLLTTYNTSLAEDLRQRLRRLGGEDVLKRVRIESVDALARSIVAEEPSVDLGRTLSDDAAMNLWHTVRIETGLLHHEADFLDDEFRHVVLAGQCTRYEQYRGINRAGRPRISTRQRREIWTLMEAYRASLSASPRQTTFAIIASEAARIAGERKRAYEKYLDYKEEQGGRDLIHREAASLMGGSGPRLPYRHIVIDEAQDLAASHWRMLRALVPEGPDDIFLVGDAHQRIYANRSVLSHYGIRTPGRASRRLTLSYRTTREILGSAGDMLAGQAFDDLDTGQDTLDGYRSVLTGHAPQYWHAPDWQTELRALAALLFERHETYGTPYEAMAVAVPDGAAITQVAYALRTAEHPVPPVEIGPDGVPEGAHGVRVGTMHRFKGLEFQRVFIAGVSDGQVPHQRIEPYRLSNPDRYRQEEQRARSLLFVAATRARDELVVTWNGRPSRLLPCDVAHTAHSATALLTGHGPASNSSAA
ncbi:UvrD-helicase domain-containing protein [Streptomyces noursei]|uniref:UvrD-helicase domain-containing protein n=1 Tax=Streptomyces noursei TaxID=1971 RepID=UPI001675C953|nr:UvrD-helicase domain-containing protein [Streptomyces noursei]MCZ1014847.1 AAA family ATPase [Streptomyces noursei]GGX48078.1 DNA helicase [Streptomyces noursei]